MANNEKTSKPQKEQSAEQVFESEQGLSAGQSADLSGEIDERDQKIADMQRKIEELEKKLQTIDVEKQTEKLNFYEYAEQYAKVKNLLGSKKAAEALNIESGQTQEQITKYVHAKMTEFLAQNPGATKEQIAQENLKNYVAVNKKIGEEVKAALDGENSPNDEKRRHGSVLRKFNAIMDKHGDKLKKAMKIVGVAGVGVAVVATGGLVLGAAAPVTLSLGVGTFVGAGVGGVVGGVKGAMSGLVMTRHGSKDSAVRDYEKLFNTDEDLQRMLNQLDHNDKQTYQNLSGAIMNYYNQGAESDHKDNKDMSKTAMKRAGKIGAALGLLGGGIGGSAVETTFGVNQVITHDAVTEQVTNVIPEIPHHTIQPGELTGQVIQNTLNDMNLGDQYNFVLPDGSTNMDLIRQFVPDWTEGTHSFAGADNMSDEGIRTILETIANQNADTEAVVVDPAWREVIKGESTTAWVGNAPVLIGSWLASVGLGGVAGKRMSDRYLWRPKPGTRISNEIAGPRPGTGSSSLDIGPAPSTRVSNEIAGPEPGTRVSNLIAGPEPGTRVVGENYPPASSSRVPDDMVRPAPGTKPIDNIPPPVSAFPENPPPPTGGPTVRSQEAPGDYPSPTGEPVYAGLHNFSMPTENDSQLSTGKPVIPDEKAQEALPSTNELALALPNTEPPMPRLSLEDLNKARERENDNAIRQGLRDSMAATNRQNEIEVEPEASEPVLSILEISPEGRINQINQILTNIYNTDGNEFFAIANPMNYENKISPVDVIDNPGIGFPTIELSPMGQQILEQYLADPVFDAKGIDGFIDYLKSIQINK